MISSKNIIFGSVVGLIFIFGGTFVFLDDGTQIQNNSEYQNHTNRTGTNSLPVTSSEITIPPTGLSAIETGPINSVQTGFVFHAPNTEWKARTITLNDGRVVTYRFGEGNPEEVALSLAEIEEVSKEQCEHFETEKGKAFYDAGLCDPNTGLRYVSPAVEKHIQAALSDSGWYNLATECEKALRVKDGDRLNEKTDSSIMYYDKIFASGFLDIDNFITIDPNTGWKKLDTGRSIGLAIQLMRAMYNGYKNPTDWVNPYGDCVDRYGSNIVRHLEQAVDIYNAPLYNTD
jgi:hypothetical protein